MSVPTQVFEGIRVLDVGHIVAGPIAASILADFGADVLKIERPGTGDPLRWHYPKDGVGLFYKVEARNKRSITLDMKQSEGQAIFHRLVERSDVVVENFRPGVMERLGHDWQTLRDLNPRLIYCRMSGFGQTGPYAHRGAYGRVGEAFSGFTHLTGDRDGPPMHSAMSLGDTVAGVWAAIGIINALYWRDAQGGDVGQVVDVGLYEPLFRQIEQQVIVFDQLGVVPTRMGNENPGDPFVGSFRTRDGRYFSFSAATTRSVTDLLRAIGMDGDPRFLDFETCLQHREAFQAEVGAWMAHRTLDEVDAAFRAYDAPGSPVMTAEDLVDDEHVLARDMIISIEDDELGHLRMQGIVPKLSETPGEVRHPGQALGAANDEVYGGLLGMSAKAIASLRERHVI